MWLNIVSFFYKGIELLCQIGEWLFTPININVVDKGLISFYDELRSMGLSNFPTWMLKFFENTQQPVYVTPISILSITFISTFFVWAIVKTLWSN